MQMITGSYLKTCGTPVHKLNGALGFNVGDGSVDIFGHHITSVEQTAGHILPKARIALHHLIDRLKTRIGDLSNRQLLMVRLLSGDDWCVSSQWEVNTWVGDQIGLELSEINVESTIETERGRKGTDDLSDETVQVGVGRLGDVQVLTADVVQRFVVQASQVTSTTVGATNQEA